MKILVTGGRDFDDKKLLEAALNRVVTGVEWYKDTIVHGGAKGADTLAGRYALKYGHTERVYLPDWDKHGKKAGILRNIEMLDTEKPNVVLAFKGGKGTTHMMEYAEKKGYVVFKVGVW